MLKEFIRKRIQAILAEVIPYRVRIDFIFRWMDIHMRVATINIRCCMRTAFSKLHAAHCHAACGFLKKNALIVIAVYFYQTNIKGVYINQPKVVLPKVPGHSVIFCITTEQAFLIVYRGNIAYMFIVFLLRNLLVRATCEQYE